VAPDAADEEAHLRQIGTLVGSSAIGAAGLNELEQIVRLLSACGYGPDRVDVRYQRGAGGSTITPARCSRRS